MVSGNYFVFDNINSNNVFVSANDGFFVTGVNVYNGAQRLIDRVDVPGRNGALITDYGSFENVTIAYNCMMKARDADDMNTRLMVLSNLFASRSGKYYKLTDSYNPNVIREARFNGIFEPEMGAGRKACNFTIEFDCKPQKFFADEWEYQEALVTQGIVRYTFASNPYNYFPMIHLRLTSSSGTATVECEDGYGAIVIANPGSIHVWVDCETQNVYSGTTMQTNANSKTTLTGKFPMVTAGVNRTFYCTGLTNFYVRTRRFWI